MRSIFVAVAIVLFAFLAIVNPTNAQQLDCPVVYGGGQMECESPTPGPNTKTTPTATPKPITTTNQTKKAPTPTPTKAPATNQSKGGLPVTQVTNTTTTPATGPEVFGLMSLLPMAAAGFYLRKKAK